MSDGSSLFSFFQVFFPSMVFFYLIFIASFTLEFNIFFKGG